MTAPNADVRLTAVQVTAYHALRRQVADAMDAAGAVLDRVSAEFIAAAQRTIILPGVVTQ